MWSCVSRKTRLKIGLAISQDLKCKKCKTKNGYKSSIFLDGKREIDGREIFLENQPTKVVVRRRPLVRNNIDSN